MITSIHNRHVKALRGLRQRRARDSSGTFLIEGYRELRRARKSVAVDRLYYCPPLWLGDNEPALLESFAAGGSRLIELATEPFRRVSYRDRPDGLLGVGRQYAPRLDRLWPGSNPLLLMSEAIEKPGNLGAMLRTADAVGATAAIVADPLTDPFHPHVIRGSVGCVFTVPLAVADTGSVLAWLRTHDIAVVAATPAASRVYWEVDLRGARAVVVGNEQHGLSSNWLTAATELVRIPMAGDADSLNVAMAAGTLLFEAVRQRATIPARAAGGPREHERSCTS